MFASATFLLIGIVASGGGPNHSPQLEARRIIEFSADSCPACRMMDPVVQSARGEGLPIQYVDVRQHPELAAQWRVQQIPTFVAVSEGREVDRVVGVTTLQRLREMVALAGTPGAAPPTIARGQSPSVDPATTLPSAPPWSGATPPDFSPPQSDHPRLANVTPRSSPSGDATPILSPTSGTPISKSIAASVRLRIEDATGHSFGTGTIIDMHDQEALVLTCGHIFRHAGKEAKIVCDSFADGAKQRLIGTLISYDLRRDVGLVSFEPGVPIEPIRVGRVGDQPDVGASVFSVGCNRGADPTVIENKVLAVNRYHGPANLVVGGRPVDGRSGGGLFTSSGTLIGVCNAADQEADEGLYAALGPIHAELESAGLDFVYRQATQDLGGRGVPPSSTIAMPSAVTGQGAGQRPSPATPGSAAGPSAEIIYIWRNANSSGERNVVVIDHPSQALLENINAELDRRGPHAPTQMHVPRGVPVPVASQPVRGQPPAATGGWTSGSQVR